MTPARRSVLDAVESSEAPISASGIIARIGSACDQATVYRALDYLERGGLAESFIIHCDEHGTERYFTAKETPHRHWFHCESCHRFIDMGTCKLDGLLDRLDREAGLEVRRHTLHCSGLCGACRKKKEK